MSLVVTEIFDAALFGEGVLQTLIHAWDNLLLPPCPEETQGINHRPLSSNENKYGLVIPQSATVWIAAVQCIDIARRYRRLPSQCFCRRDQSIACMEMGIPYGDNILCKFCEAPSGQSPGSTIHYLLDKVFVKADSIEPYDTENLEIVPHGFKFLTKPYSVFQINFNCLEDIKRHLHCERIEHSLMADEGGSVDAIVLWFHLKLDEKTQVSTAPFEECGYLRGWCWHQAIFPVLEPTSVHPGETLNIDVSTDKGIFNISPNYEKIQKLKKESAPNHSNVKCNLGQDLSCTSNIPRFSVSKALVPFLNNRTWINALQETATSLYKTLCSLSPSSYQVLDFNPFPFLGLEILKLCKSCVHPWKLLAFAETFADEQFIRYVAEKYGIEGKQITFFSGQKWREEILEKIFDIINLNLVDYAGELCENLTDIIPALRSSLSSNGVMIPHSVELEGQIIESEWLLKNSEVTSNENVHGFNIAHFVNVFSTNYHPELNIYGMPHTPLSEPALITKLYTNAEGRGSICSEDDGETVISIRSGACVGFLYWMKLDLLHGLPSVSSASFDSHCRQIAFLSGIPSVEKSEVLLKWKYYFGMFSCKLIKCQQ